MKRIALRAGKIAAVLGSAAVLLFSCGEPRLATQPAPTVIDVPCHLPDDPELANEVRWTRSDGTPMVLRCARWVDRR